MMGHIADDKFRVFISHKHEDFAFATTVAKSLQSLSPALECFVSGSNISAGADWNREIREALSRSHLLVLLFTSPTQNWDWCLYEAGLFTRLDVTDVHAVVSLFHPEGAAPRPLENLQGVPADREKIREFLVNLCKSTWRVSDDWRKGALNLRVRPEAIAKAAEHIERAFPVAKSQAAHYPCHRLVLDLTGSTESTDGIPDDARVVEGPGATGTYTLSLFRVASGSSTRTWGDLVAAVGGQNAPWRRQLDLRFAAALREELFAPTTATLRAFGLEQRHRRYYRPIIYKIVRAPAPPGASPSTAMRPARTVTIVFDPQLAPARVGGAALNLVRINARFAAEVFDAFCGTVAERQSSQPDVFNEIGEAFHIIYEEAERYGVFDLGELEGVYGNAYQGSEVQKLSVTWDDTFEQLQNALDAQNAAAVEDLLAQMREMNRNFSLAATTRYLATLEADREQPRV